MGRCRECGGKPKRRVLRGGAFNNNAQNVRCASRDNWNNDHNNNVGVRLAVSTLLCVLPEMWCGGAYARPYFTNEAFEEKWRGLFLASSFCVRRGHIPTAAPPRARRLRRGTHYLRIKPSPALASLIYTPACSRRFIHTLKIDAICNCRPHRVTSGKFAQVVWAVR